MAKWYQTVGDSMAQATTTFAAVQTLPDGGTLSAITVPTGATKISVVGTAVTPDGAHTIDTGNNFTLQFSGTGMKDGVMELYAGTLASQETGTSVTGTLTQRPAFYRPVDINVQPGQVNISGAYDGTSPGTPFIVVTVGFD